MKTIRIADDLPPEIETLASEARAEGWRHIDRLIAEWSSGAERFDKPGEALFAVFAAGDLAGVGGLTREPADPSGDVLRARRLYVSPRFRRQGVGRALASAIVQQAQACVSRVTVNARQGAAGAFWEGLGFALASAGGFSHELPFSDDDLGARTR